MTHALGYIKYAIKPLTDCLAPYFSRFRRRPTQTVGTRGPGNTLGSSAPTASAPADISTSVDVEDGVLGAPPSGIRAESAAIETPTADSEAETTHLMRKGDSPAGAAPTQLSPQRKQ